MSGWHELANSRKSSFVAFFVQYDLLPRSGIFPGRAGRPVRAGGATPRPGCFIELLGHPDLRKPVIAMSSLPLTKELRGAQERVRCRRPPRPHRTLAYSTLCRPQDADDPRLFAIG
jgi:hypothetical protein